MHTSMFLFVYVLLTRCLSMRLLTYRSLDATNWIVQHVGVILVHQAIFVRLVILVTCFVTMIRCYSKMGPRRSRTGLLKPTFKTLDSCKTREQSGRENMMILQLSLLVIYGVAPSLSCLWINIHSCSFWKLISVSLKQFAWVFDIGSKTVDNSND